jgi:YfiH family protein
VFAFRDRRGRVDVAFTDRHGGVSAGPYASLNLGGRGDPDEVAANLDLVARALASPSGDPAERSAPADGVPPRVVGMRQVHGADVHVVTERTTGPVPAVDALVTALPGMALLVRAADCVPVLLADEEHGVVGAAHAGRAGVAGGVVSHTVAAMRDLGATDIAGWIGPHVCGACYEVPAALRDEVAAVVPATRAETSWGTPALDLGAGVRAQLEALDVAVVEVARCTREDEDLYSYRRQGAESGRLGGLVWVRP